MLSHTDLKPGVQFIYNNEPWEVLESQFIKMAQRRPVVQTKIRSLITGKVQKITVQQGEIFEEANLEKINIKFLYSHRDHYFFCQEGNPSNRFSFTLEQIGPQAKFLKPNLILEGLIFKEKIINVKIPIKIQLKVKETAPGIKGDRAQAGTKKAILENGTEIQVPLFIESGDVIEINTETGEYVKRV